MARKFTLLLLLGAYALSFNPVFAAAKPVTNLPTNGSDFCDAPAPGNFHVEGINEGYVELTWTPAWPGADQTLVLYREDAFGNWTNLGTYAPVPGDAYSVPISEAGSYLVTIATNCTSGETSYKTAEKPFKVIELTTAGRVPVNPQPASTCDGINMNNHFWVGFKLDKVGTNISNLFEITLSGQVKRVYAPEPPHQIVAVDAAGHWPKTPFDTLKVYLGEFRVFDLVDGNPSNFITIGQLKFEAGTPPIVKLCQMNTPPWKLEYSFTPLTASTTLLFPQGLIVGGGDRLESFRVENPFTNNLNIFIPESFPWGDKASIRLLNSSGQLLMAYILEIQSPKTSLLVDGLPSGLYIVQIETEHETLSMKVVKSE